MHARKIFRNILWTALLLGVVGSSVAAPGTVSRHFDFSPSPITLTPEGDPIILEVDFGQQFASFASYQMRVVSPGPTGGIDYNWGVLYPDGATTDPCCAGPLPFGVASYKALVARGGTIGEFTSGAESSESMIQRAFVDVATDILDGEFRAFFWLVPGCVGSGPFPYGCTWPVSSSLVVSSIDIILVNAEPSTVPAPPPAALLAAGLVWVGAVRSRRSGIEQED